MLYSCINYLIYFSFLFMISCGLDLAVESHALRAERYGIFLSGSRFLGNRNYLYNKDRGVAQVRVTMITPPATPEMIVKLKKQLEFHRPIRYSSVDFEFVLKHLFLLVAEKGLVVNTLLAS